MICKNLILKNILTSEYPKTHPLYSIKNQAIAGLFKDEVKSKIITEFVGLRSKLYSLTIDGEGKKGNKIRIEKKICKGVKMCVIENDLRFNDYLTTLENEEQMTREFILIRSNKHDLKAIHIKKIALSAFDNKGYIIIIYISF